MPAALRGRVQFERVSREGKRLGHGYLQVKILSNSLQINRLGIVVPIKAIRNSVDRNRVRRLVKEAFRTLPSTITGYDIVVIIRRKPDIDHMHFVRDSIDRIFKSIRD